ncbi:EF-P beta-lysylation protein EpmB [Glaciecola sp. MH2013]|uniref:EF-P beta-lysylation protein EpmB n=1 Tax=Glaciecola sp. MH2013 TaxID=2785524 RepID=UPI00189F8C60|nr:EF-P beta-lysylation protein EpmB [Glaciecola sp. MH2013]MBF7071889.1 EF-P beta-lysylation protein EpmB [Glaciecola sp. MH2013]
MNQIIPKNLIAVESNWQKELSNCFTTLESLFDFLELDLQIAKKHTAARKLFAMRVPHHFATLMEKGNINDPLLKQVLPLIDEYEDTPGFVSDPLLEQGNAVTGLLHKYSNRALLMIKTGCAVNCRYCFRREFPYSENTLNRKSMEEALSYIGQAKSINEVIFSGGDPLMAKNEHLQWVISKLENIEHVKRLRIHTRLPVVIPNRIDNDFIDIMTASKLQKVMVLHINHPNELSGKLFHKCQSLKKNNVTLLNQAVFLKGVNDSVSTLENLSEKLFEFGVLPYYLHLLDRVKGSAHFEVSEADAVAVMQELIKRLPGFLVPKLVREIGGQPSKTPIDLNLQP